MPNFRKQTYDCAQHPSQAGTGLRAGPLRVPPAAGSVGTGRCGVRRSISLFFEPFGLDLAPGAHVNTASCSSSGSAWIMVCSACNYAFLAATIATIAAMRVNLNNKTRTTA